MTIHAITLRAARPHDAVALQCYFRALSKTSRYNRFLGTVADLSLADIDRTIGCNDSGFFCVIATRGTETSYQIVGESVCALAASAEIAMSIDDDVQGCGVGRALLMAMETLAAQQDACELYGTILSGNDRIRKLATSLGYEITRSDGDWNHCLLRKMLAPVATIPFLASPTITASLVSRLDGAFGSEFSRK